MLGEPVTFVAFGGGVAGPGPRGFEAGRAPPFPVADPGPRDAGGRFCAGIARAGALFRAAAGGLGAFYRASSRLMIIRPKRDGEIYHKLLLTYSRGFYSICLCKSKA